MKVWVIEDWHGYTYVCARGKLEKWVENEAREPYKHIFPSSEKFCYIDEPSANPEGDMAYTAYLTEIYE